MAKTNPRVPSVADSALFGLAAALVTLLALILMAFITNHAATWFPASGWQGQKVTAHPTDNDCQYQPGFDSSETSNCVSKVVTIVDNDPYIINWTSDDRLPPQFQTEIWHTQASPTWQQYPPASPVGVAIKALAIIGFLAVLTADGLLIIRFVRRYPYKPFQTSYRKK